MRGIELARRFYEEVVGLLLSDHYPDLEYATALIGAGSEVLGYDDLTSQDHDWGVRLQLFIKESDYSIKEELYEFFNKHLPPEFYGFPVFWYSAKMDKEKGEFHKIEIYTLDEYLDKMFAHSKQQWDVEDWLKAPEQRLLVFTAGAVFHDEIGELTEMRKYLSYYPADIWLFCLRGELEQLGQNMAFPGRARMVDDHVGTRLLVAQQIERVINIAFLLEKTYRPYQKWAGTAFKQLVIAEKLEHLIVEALDTKEWETREQTLNQIYLELGRKMEDMGLIPEGKTVVQQYHTRPIEIVSFTLEVNKIKPEIERILDTQGYNTGSVNQIARDRTLLSYPGLTRNLFNFDMVEEVGL